MPKDFATREGKGGGKFKKLKKDKLQITIPPGCASRDSQNRPNCFAFNLGKCSLKVNKGRCAKGYHQLDATSPTPSRSAELCGTSLRSTGLLLCT